MRKPASYAMIGLLAGAPLGVLIGWLTHNPVLGTAGPGIGLVIGMALSAKAKDAGPQA